MKTVCLSGNENDRDTNDLRITVQQTNSPLSLSNTLKDDTKHFALLWAPTTLTNRVLIPTRPYTCAASSFLMEGKINSPASQAIKQAM